MQATPEVGNRASGSHGGIISRYPFQRPQGHDVAILSKVIGMGRA